MAGLNSQRETRAINREQCDHFLTKWRHKTLQMFTEIESSADSVDSCRRDTHVIAGLHNYTIHNKRIFFMFTNTGDEDRQKNLVLVKPKFSATSLQECRMVT